MRIDQSHVECLAQGHRLGGIQVVQQRVRVHQALVDGRAEWQIKSSGRILKDCSGWMELDVELGVDQELDVELGVDQNVGGPEPGLSGRRTRRNR
jgi:hypothetical protein